MSKEPQEEKHDWWALLFEKEPPREEEQEQERDGWAIGAKIAELERSAQKLIDKANVIDATPLWEWSKLKLTAMKRYAEQQPDKAVASRAAPPEKEDARPTLSREERERILAAEVYSYTKHDYEVKHSTSTTAHLVWKRPKTAFAANLFLTFITLGFWLIIWTLLGFLGDLVTPKHIYIEVLPDGTVAKNTHGWR